MSATSVTRPAAPAAESATTRLPIAVVVLTRDEELNLGTCLASVASWADQVFVVDSGSVDQTVQIAQRHGAQVVTHRFEGYSEQRNWALDHLSLTHDWVLTLDADERVSPELARELEQWFGGGDPERTRRLQSVDGFYIKRRLIFMSRWIRHGGYYPTWLLRLYRRSGARWDGRSVNEHLVVQGNTAKLQQDIVHDDRRGLDHWTMKHTRYATLEARELLEDRPAVAGRGALFGAQDERKRWLKHRVWNRMPLFFRPVAYFLYRYVLRGGFLDGRAGLVYHALQGLWYPFLIDAKAWEARRSAAPRDRGPPDEGRGVGTPPHQARTARNAERWRERIAPGVRRGERGVMATGAAARIDYYRRAFLSYGLRTRSHLSFWHDRPEVNQAAYLPGGEAFYLTFRQKARYAGPFDAQGVPLLDYRGRLGIQYNPIAIAQYGLAHYNAFLETAEAEHRQASLRQADWLVANLERNDHGVHVWRHHFDWRYREGLIAPWASGLAQGQGISLLLRAHGLERRRGYDEAAGRAFEAFRREVGQGGVTHRDGRGGVWFEEYLVAPPSHILNGFISAAWGVHDYARFRDDGEAGALFDAAAATILANLPRYDVGYWSSYEIRPGGMRMLASPYYHALHVSQLEVMGRITGQAEFLSWAERWRSYRERPLNRLRALAHKALFKLRYY